MDWSMPGFPVLHYIPELLVILLVLPVCSSRLFETSLLIWWTMEWLLGFPGGSVVKYPPANGGDAGDMGLIPGLERSSGGGNDNPLQYSCLGNPMGREAWWATVHGIAKSWTQLSKWVHAKRLLIVWARIWNQSRGFPGGLGWVEWPWWWTFQRMISQVKGCTEGEEYFTPTVHMPPTLYIIQSLIMSFLVNYLLCVDRVRPGN